jgi:ADP-ribose pyrophosphatase
VIAAELLDSAGRTVHREWVHHPGAAAVLPILNDGRILLVEQTRPATGGRTLEIPAGRLEVSEEPQACAIRELQEETGYAARIWRSLGSFYSTPGASDERIHLFLATDLVQVSSADGIEIAGLFPCSADWILDAFRSGRIVDGKTLLAASLYRLSSGRP